MVKLLTALYDESSCVSELSTFRSFGRALWIHFAAFPYIDLAEWLVSAVLVLPTQTYLANLNWVVWAGNL